MKHFVLVSVCILMIFVTSCANASFDLGLENFFFGYNDDIDRAINRVHDTLEHGRRIINQVLDKGDVIAEKHINNIDRLEARIVNDIKEIEQNVSEDIDSKIERINSSVETAIADMNIIEEVFFRDLENSIEKAECAVDKMLNERIKNALGRFGKIIGTNKIRITAPSLYPKEERKEYCIMEYCLVRGEVFKEFDINYPFSLTYDSIKEYLLDRLNDIRLDTPVDSLVITYSTLSELSKRAICHHPGVERFVTDYVYFMDKVVQLQEFMKRQRGEL